MNKKLRNETPKRYRQPDNEFSARIVMNHKEIVTYSAESHIRIWYNNQQDGYPLHSHPAFEICICIQNTYDAKVNAEKYVLKEGDILIIPPNTLHEFVNDHYGVRFIYLIEANEFYHSRDYKSIEPLLFNAFLCNKETCPDIYEQVYSCFMDMNAAYFDSTCFWETIVFSKLYQVFSEIAKHAEHAVTDDGQSHSSSIHRINNLMQFVDVNYSEDISTESAAEFTGFSKFHFLRLFKLHTGYTFHDYLTLKRITVAGDLLSGNTPITDVAFRTGFNSLPSFCRAFKKHTGYSPSEYRRLRNTTEDGLTLHSAQRHTGNDVL